MCRKALTDHFQLILRMIGAQTKKLVLPTLEECVLATVIGVPNGWYLSDLYLKLVLYYLVTASVSSTRIPPKHFLVSSMSDPPILGSSS